MPTPGFSRPAAFAALLCLVAAGPAPAYEDRSTWYVAPDHQGGAYVLDTNVGRLRVRHVTAAGATAPGYPVGGFPLDTIPTPSWSVVAADGFGGAIVAYRANRTVGFGMYATRALTDAAPAPMWPANGAAAYLGPVGPSVPGIAPDGTGGLFLSWQDFRRDYNDQDVYVQRIGGDGVRATGWPDTALAVCRAPGSQFDPVMLADGSGGCFVAWWDERAAITPATSSYDIYAQLLRDDGTPKWTLDGVAACKSTGNQFYPSIASDGMGGALVAWLEESVATIPEIPGAYGIGLQRLTGEGVVPTGWPANGLFVGVTNDPAYRGAPVPLIGDGAGGAYLCTSTMSGGGSGPASVVQLLHIGANGTTAAGWPAGGITLDTDTREQSIIGLIADGLGGAIATWATRLGDQPSGAPIYQIRMQRVTGAGLVAAGWPAPGQIVGTDVRSSPSVVTDGQGGATLVLVDFVVGGVSATRVTRDGVAGPGWPGYPSNAFLFPPYPQPASGDVHVAFAIPELGPVDVRIVDVAGRAVRTLLRTPSYGAGRHVLVWDGRDDRGRRAPNGLYLVRVEFSGSVASTRLVLAR